MLIGFDGSRAFLKDRTGTENYSYQLLLNLSKIDTKNQYLVYLRPGVEVKKGDWPENFRFKTINFPRLWTQLGLSLATFTGSLDVLFVPAHTLPLIRRPSLKTVMTVHDLGAEYLPKTHQLKQRLYLGLITKVQLKSAAKLIAVSKATKEDLIKRVGVKPQKIEVIYEAVEKNLFKPSKNDPLLNILNKFDLKKEKYFVFIGTVQPRKNLVRLIQAFARVLSEVEGSDLKLVIAGSRGWLSDQIYREPERLGIKSRVKFLGRVTDEEAASLLTGAVALTFPSLFEGFGLPILEAFACHCPVITSSVSSMPEVAGEAALLVDPLNLTEITGAMNKITDPNTRQTLINKGLKQLKNFSWEKTAKGTLEVLEGVKNGG